MNGLDLNTRGKIAVVTGSTNGIGLAIAEQFLKSGMHVYINSRQEESVKKAVERLRSEGFSVSGLIGDAADEKFVKEGVEKIISECGGIDILVNNVGMYEQEAIEDISLQAWENVLRANLTSSFLWLKEAVPHMKEKRYGKIISIASVAGISGRSKSAHYNAAKGGIISLTKGLAKDLGSFNITVNAIAPGFIPTGLMQGELFEKAEKFNKERTALPRLGMPKDVAGAALFLASSLADFITGEVIVVDGGFSIA
jgi:NAD(P)-dependent dehydrogenase (short-subunit alcohol dehydrogenase family)